jgi:hypothetical protein
MLIPLRDESMAPIEAGLTRVAEKAWHAFAGIR